LCTNRKGAHGFEIYRIASFNIHKTKIKNIKTKRVKKTFSTLFFFVFLLNVLAQQNDTLQEPITVNLEKTTIENTKYVDSIKASYRLPAKQKKEKAKVDPESGKANYLDYKIISNTNDTILVDTTLTISKEYKMNYLRRDLFGLHSFQNQGQVFTSLTYDRADSSLLPKMGANAKHINYYEIKDIKYYQVPTPTSEFLYRTGLEQGQVLDSRLAMNLHKRFNISLAYRGLRSLGNYRNSLSSHTNFRTTISYLSKNKRYQLRTHFASQKIENQENGGITDEHTSNFENNVSDFEDRGKINVNLENGSSFLIGKRTFLDHNYKLLNSRDSLVGKISNLKIGHVFTYETKQYKYNIPSETPFWGNSFKQITEDNTSYKSMRNQGYLDFTSPYVLGKFRVLANHQHYFQGYKSIVNTNSDNGTYRIKGNYTSLGAQWKARLNTIALNTKVERIVNGEMTGNNFTAKASYKKKNTEISALLQMTSKAPDFNFNFYQSNFQEYNWRNDFKNSDTRILKIGIKNKWLQTFASLTQIENYVYFENNTQATPAQFDGTVNYFKIKAANEINLGKFALNTTALFQKVQSGAAVFRVPEWVARSSFYYTSYFFKKKSLYLQTGLTVNYFSAFKAPTYNAVIGDFVLQNNQNIGGKPILEYFVNGQIRRTRIFIKAENILSAINKTNYYAAPNNPYRDFAIRFGIVWNFFK
jgi:hypothetical protein